MPELRRVTARVTLRKGTTTQWKLTNPVLLDGELAWESDATRLKVGNGISTWNELDYYKVGDGEVPGTFIHNGAIFPTHINSVNLALKHTQGQINKWKSCALQDFKDGYSNVSPTCTSDGTLPGSDESDGTDRTTFLDSDIGRDVIGLYNNPARGLENGVRHEILAINDDTLATIRVTSGSGFIRYMHLGTQWSFAE